MPRLRTIKPGFFENEVLCSLSPHHRLAFAGLWCWADRAGRLEDRPVRLRANIFPYEQVDMDALLSDLTKTGFLRRYEADGQRYIQIRTFEKHQHPHRDEKKSIIPEEHCASMVDPHCNIGGSHDVARLSVGELSLGSGNLEPGVKGAGAPPRAKRSAPKEESDADLALADQMRASVRDPEPTWTDAIWQRERVRFAKAIRLARESDGRSPDVLAELCRRWGELPQQARAWTETHPMDWKRDVAKNHAALNGKPGWQPDARRGVAYTGTDAEFEEMAQKYGRAD